MTSDGLAGTQRPGTLFEVAAAFLRLGCLSFGGPIAHLGYLRAEFVERRAWLDDTQYADLVALCQFLPGPASSQVVFALGMQRKGALGALVASLCFTLPSALLMVGFASGVSRAAGLYRSGWLHGLQLAAVAVVAHAVWAMGRKLCPDPARIAICISAAATLLLCGGSVVQVGVIAIGAVVGSRLESDLALSTVPTFSSSSEHHHGAAKAALLAFVVLLVGLPPLAALLPSRALAEFDGFYRAGSLVFGGGHVVLPLLREEIVPRGWLANETFLAGYSAAQAVPGPLFSFAGYLGAAMHPGKTSWLWGLWCLLAIFLPAWLLVFGALPFWNRLREKRWARKALAGASAAVVGVLLATLYQPLLSHGVRGPRDAAAALVAFALLEHGHAPPWLVVAGCAAVGRLLLIVP